MRPIVTVLGLVALALLRGGAATEVPIADQYTACLNYAECASLYLLPSAMDQFERLAARTVLDTDLPDLGGSAAALDRLVAQGLVAGALRSPLCMPLQTVRREPDGVVTCVCRDSNDCELRYCQTDSLAWLMGIVAVLIVVVIGIYGYLAIKNKKKE